MAVGEIFRFKAFELNLYRETVILKMYALHQEFYLSDEMKE